MSDSGLVYYKSYLYGSEEALEQLVKLYSDGLIRYIYCIVENSAEAEDIMEDTIVTLITKRKRLNDDASLKAYLYRIAHNRAISHLRKSKGDIPLSDVENVLAGSDLETVYFRRARNNTVYVCMQNLPDQYRQILQLTYFDGFSLQDVSHITKKSMKQVYNLHTRAKQALKELLIKEGISYEDL